MSKLAYAINYVKKSHLSKAERIDTKGNLKRRSGQSTVDKQSYSVRASGLSAPAGVRLTATQADQRSGSTNQCLPENSSQAMLA